MNWRMAYRILGERYGFTQAEVNEMTIDAAMKTYLCEEKDVRPDYEPLPTGGRLVQQSNAARVRDCAQELTDLILKMSHAG